MQKDSLRDTLLPSGAQIFLYFLIPAIVFLATSLDIITAKLSSAPTPQDLSQATHSTLLAGLAALGQVRGFNTFILVLFWGGVGLAANTLIWGLLNIFTQTRNEVVIEKEYANKSQRLERAKGPLTQAGLALLLISLLALAARGLLPQGLIWFRHFLIQAPQLSALVGLIGVLAAAALTLYFFWTGLKIVLLSN